MLLGDNMDGRKVPVDDSLSIFRCYALEKAIVFHPRVNEGAVFFGERKHLFHLIVFVNTSLHGASHVIIGIKEVFQTQVNSLKSLLLSRNAMQ